MAVVRGSPLEFDLGFGNALHFFQQRSDVVFSSENNPNKYDIHPTLINNKETLRVKDEESHKEENYPGNIYYIGTNKVLPREQREVYYSLHGKRPMLKRRYQLKREVVRKEDKEKDGGRKRLHDIYVKVLDDAEKLISFYAANVNKRIFPPTKAYRLERVKGRRYLKKFDSWVTNRARMATTKVRTSMHSGQRIEVDEEYEAQMERPSTVTGLEGKLFHSTDSSKVVRHVTHNELTNVSNTSSTLVEEKNHRTLTKTAYLTGKTTSHSPSSLIATTLGANTTVLTEMTRKPDITTDQITLYSSLHSHAAISPFDMGAFFNDPIRRSFMNRALDKLNGSIPRSIQTEQPLPQNSFAKETPIPSATRQTMSSTRNNTVVLYNALQHLVKKYKEATEKYYNKRTVETLYDIISPEMSELENTYENTDENQNSKENEAIQLSIIDPFVTFTYTNDTIINPVSNYTDAPTLNSIEIESTLNDEEEYNSKNVEPTTEVSRETSKMSKDLHSNKNEEPMSEIDTISEVEEVADKENKIRTLARELINSKNLPSSNNPNSEANDRDLYKTEIVISAPKKRTVRSDLIDYFEYDRDSIVSTKPMSLDDIHIDVVDGSQDQPNVDFDNNPSEDKDKNSMDEFFEGIGKQGNGEKMEIQKSTDVVTELNSQTQPTPKSLHNLQDVLSELLDPEDLKRLLNAKQNISKTKKFIKFKTATKQTTTTTKGKHVQKIDALKLLDEIFDVTYNASTDSDSIDEITPPNSYHNEESVKKLTSTKKTKSLTRLFNKIIHTNVNEEITPESVEKFDILGKFKTSIVPDTTTTTSSTTTLPKESPDFFADPYVSANTDPFISPDLFSLLVRSAAGEHTTPIVDLDRIRSLAELLNLTLRNNTNSTGGHSYTDGDEHSTLTKKLRTAKTSKAHITTVATTKMHQTESLEANPIHHLQAEADAITSFLLDIDGHKVNMNITRDQCSCQVVRKELASRETSGRGTKLVNKEGYYILHTKAPQPYCIQPIVLSSESTDCRILKTSTLPVCQSSKCKTETICQTSSECPTESIPCQNGMDISNIGTAEQCVVEIPWEIFTTTNGCDTCQPETTPPCTKETPCLTTQNPTCTTKKQYSCLANVARKTKNQGTPTTDECETTDSDNCYEEPIFEKSEICSVIPTLPHNGKTTSSKMPKVPITPGGVKPRASIRSSTSKTRSSTNNKKQPPVVLTVKAPISEEGTEDNETSETECIEKTPSSTGKTRKTTKKQKTIPELTEDETTEETTDETTSSKSQTKLKRTTTSNTLSTEQVPTTLGTTKQLNTVKSTATAKMSPTITTTCTSHTESMCGQVVWPTPCCDVPATCFDSQKALANLLLKLADAATIDLKCLPVVTAVPPCCPNTECCETPAMPFLNTQEPEEEEEEVTDSCCPEEECQHSCHTCHPFRLEDPFKFKCGQSRPTKRTYHFRYAKKDMKNMSKLKNKLRPISDLKPPIHRNLRKSMRSISKKNKNAQLKISFGVKH